MKRQPRADYHHGDLRQACIEQGCVLLREGGKDAVSLREVARRCGVSVRAPYQHFADKLTFLAAIAESGFERFGRALATAQRKQAQAPVELRLLALANAYIDFAQQEPALMQLMFDDTFPERAERFPTLDRAAVATFDQLRHEVSQLDPLASPKEQRQRAATAWALVHGLAELIRTEQFGHVLKGKAATQQLVTYVVRQFTRR